MLAGYLLKSKMPEGFLNTLAFVIFAIFGVTTMLEGGGMLLPGNGKWILTAVACLLFVIACVFRFYRIKKEQ